MKILRKLDTRYRSIALRSRAEEELDEELAFHLEMEVEKNLKAGMSTAEAKRAARLSFGGLEQTKEECRDSWGTRLIFDFFRDLRLGMRRLAKDMGYASMVVLSLSLGIGAAITIFAFLNAYLLKPYPYPDEDRLAIIRPVNEAFGPMSVSYTNYLDWAERNETFESIAAARFRGYNLTGIDVPESLDAVQASKGFLPMMGAKASHGRLFGAHESHREAAPTAVLTHGFWNRFFSSDPQVIGKSLLLDGELHTVIGILEEGFQFPPTGEDFVEVWTPLELQERDSDFMERFAHNGTLAIGKLKEGVSLKQAQADLNRVTQQIELENPDANMDDSVLVNNARESTNRDRRPALLMLMAAVGCLLLIVCVNAAGLLAARAASRNQEITFRAALGAKRWDIIRQLLSENVILTALGAAGGLFAAMWGSRLLYNLLGDQAELREVPPILFEQNMLLFFGAVTLCAGLLFSLFPFFQSSVVATNTAASGGTRTASSSKRHQRARQVLVISEIALALVILSAAGLLVRSYQHYLNTDPGYNPSNVLTMRLELPGSSYDSDQKRINFYRELLEKAESLPTLQSLGLSSTLLGGNQTTYVTEDNPLEADAQAPFTEHSSVTPEFMRAMGMRLIAGRLLTERDTEDSAPVALVDERFFERWWPDQNPIGKRFQFGGSADPDGAWIEIVGVVSHIKHQGIDQESRESVYRPAYQAPFEQVNIVARTSGDPLALVDPFRRVVSEIDSNLTVSRITPLQEIVNNQAYLRRVLTTLLAVFAVAALCLAAFGIYGVTAYSVAQRRQEFGIRMALGGRKSDVAQLVLRSGAKMTFIGVLIGLIVSLGASSLLRSIVFGVSPFDPLTFAMTTIALSGCVMAACYLPARRASNTDPMKALRTD